MNPLIKSLIYYFVVSSVTTIVFFGGLDGKIGLAIWLPLVIIGVVMTIKRAWILTKQYLLSLPRIPDEAIVEE